MDGLKTILIEIKESSVKMPCEAFDMRIALLKNCHDAKMLMQGMLVCREAWRGICVGDKYLHFEFIDEDTGEMTEFNCRIDMHKVMVKYKMYPELMTNSIHEYLETIKNKTT